MRVCVRCVCEVCGRLCERVCGKVCGRVCVRVCGMVSVRVCKGRVHQMCYSGKVLILVTCTSSLWKRVCPITSLQPHSTLLLLPPFLKKPSLVLSVFVQYM